MEFFLAKVKVQRDNGPGKPDVRGKWVAVNGFSGDIRAALIFRNKGEVTARLPRLWEFEVIPFQAVEGVSFVVKKD